MIRRMMGGFKTFFLETLPTTITSIITSFQSQPNEPERESQQQQRPPAPAVQMIEQWEKMMLTFCLASAIAIATVSVQTGTKLSPMFHFLSLALMACFAFTVSAKLTQRETVSQILYCLGGFWFVTAFFIAIAIPYALQFQIITLAIYLIFFSITLLSHFSAG